MWTRCLPTTLLSLFMATHAFTSTGAFAGKLNNKPILTSKLRGGGSVDVTRDDASKRVLVTGGAGYIGSHTCLELVNAGKKVVVVDNLQNSDLEALRRVRDLTKVP